MSCSLDASSGTSFHVAYDQIDQESPPDAWIRADLDLYKADCQAGAWRRLATDDDADEPEEPAERPETAAGEPDGGIGANMDVDDDEF